MRAKNFGRARRDFMPQNTNTLGSRLKAARIRANVTQADLGALLGVSGSLVNLWESDTKPGPRIEQLQNIARLLDIPVMDLIGESQPVYGWTREDLQIFAAHQRVALGRAKEAADRDSILAAQTALNWATETLDANRFDEDAAEE